MQYTLDDLSSFTGVDQDTLTSYEEEGLLESHGDVDHSPKYGYDSLLALQQIMLYREQSLSVNQIKERMQSEPKELLGRLHDHRLYLLRESSRIHTLIQSVDETIESLELDKEIEPDHLFQGFGKEKQSSAWSLNHSPREIESSNASAQMKEDYLSSQETLDMINERLQHAMERGLTPASEEVQSTVRMHLDWVRQFYTPTATIYKGLADLYVDKIQYREIYNRYHPGMAEYMRDSMLVLADRELE
ncbi:MerR family transcriptional regulator [Paenibacillus gallinarum]|uniref:TipAS antibiotic-recognition domain-containing protein n=1 Tax=Paenibacillus gallinarum TaxID=2762232 RepID=A0ABR8SZ95_9BACL|nr:TipAS antibiotic-recognition domain-containing protein [Paenibacillus gallinarum]MBD7968836.1 TipAS antibiotic-recognition domain-containing protein [Paenibacillus gallinarum]